jgi:rhodanese-related sulfurtransferase
MNLLYILIGICISLGILYIVYSSKKALRFIPEPEVRSYLSKNRGILVDVRTNQERMEGKSQSRSLHLPIDRLVFDLERMIPDKTQLIVFCCKRAIRSEGAAVIARKLGYNNVSYTGNCDLI